MIQFYLMETCVSYKKRSVFVLDKDTGKFIKRCASIKEAGEFTGASPPNIGKVLRNDRKSLKGYIFKYEDGKPPQKLKPQKRKRIFSNEPKFIPYSKTKPILIFQTDYSGEKFLQECRSAYHCEEVIGLKRAGVYAVLKSKSRKYKNYFLIYKNEFIEYFPSSSTKRKHILNNFQDESFEENTMYYIMHNESLQNIIKFVTTGNTVHSTSSGPLHQRGQNNSLPSKDLPQFVSSAAVTHKQFPKKNISEKQLGTTPTTLQP